MKATSLDAHAVDVIEAAYVYDRPEREWLAGIAAAARPALDRGLGVLCGLFDARGPGGVVIPTFVSDGVTKERLAAVVAASPAVTRDPRLRARTYGSALSFGSVSHALGEALHTSHPALQVVRDVGVADQVVLKSFDAAGVGFVLVAPARELVRVSSAECEVWTRIATHISAGLRVRGALAAARAPERPASGADAVLAPSGALLHAEPAAQGRASREALREAVRARATARGALRRTDPDAAVNLWRALVAGRWTLLEQVDRDGKRMLLARKNAPLAPPAATLTERERQVAALAALGHSNKLIAYELGLSPSTVATHLSAAQRKLRAPSRLALASALRAVGGEKARP